MALTVNTNISSLIAQRSLNNATNSMNLSLERMSTGYKINHSKDSAAGYAIAEQWETQLRSLDVASDNAAMGLDMLTTAEGTYGLLVDHIQRVRDLTEQAANGTYGSASLEAINKEMKARFLEIDRIAKNAEFNGIKLMDDNNTDPVVLQVGIKSDTNSQISLAAELFKGADLVAIQTMGNFDGDSAEEMANECSGFTAGTGGGANTVDHATPIAALEKLDNVINAISSRATDLGAAQNRVESAMSAIEVQAQNLTSSLSTLRDTDVAAESSTYIQQQILQQASATLLSTANQLPSIALNLI